MGVDSITGHTVLGAHGWINVPTAREFPFNYEIDEETQSNRKKSYRYRWPDDVRNEFLAWLLQFNAERAAEEVGSGAETLRQGSGTGVAKTLTRR